MARRKRRPEKIDWLIHANQSLREASEMFIARQKIKYADRIEETTSEERKRRLEEELEKVICREKRTGRIRYEVLCQIVVDRALNQTGIKESLIPQGKKPREMTLKERKTLNQVRQRALELLRSVHRGIVRFGGDTNEYRSYVIRKISLKRAELNELLGPERADVLVQQILINAQILYGMLRKLSEQ